MVSPLKMIWVVWNVFLAVIPVGLAHLMEWAAARDGRRIGPSRQAALLLIGTAWLLFMPNTCYLLTEWRHFLERLQYTDMNVRWQGDSRAALSLMLQTLFYLAYSGIGVLCFALAIRPVARIAGRYGATVWIWAIPFYLLMSLGVYLGLILRFNSWDFLNRPGEIWSAVLGLAERPSLSLVVVLFAGFLWLMYWLMTVWIDGLICRIQAAKRPR